jgi:hypothetical protein
VFVPRWLPEAAGQFEQIKTAASQAFENRGGKGKATKQEGLFKQVLKCINNLIENPRYPALRTHEFHSLRHPWQKDGKVFEAYVQNNTPGAYRVFWCYGPGKSEITFIAITPHP